MRWPGLALIEQLLGTMAILAPSGVSKLAAKGSAEHGRAVTAG